MKTFVDYSHLIGFNKRKFSTQQLSYTINKMTLHKKKLSNYSTHLNLSQNCLNCYTSYINQLCDLEQELVMSNDLAGIKIKDNFKNIINLLSNQQVNTHDKMRIIILYIMSKNGISEDYLNKLILHAKLSQSEKQTIVNLNLLGIDIVTTSTSDVNIDDLIILF